MSASNVINTALIVTAHPVENSLSQSLAQRIAGKLQEQGTQVEIADLHAEGFSPTMIRPDLDLYHGDARALPDEVLREQQRVERADMLVFVFPIYWWSVPALLKGWFDRVLTVNWAYKVAEDGRIVGNLRDVPVRWSQRRAAIWPGSISTVIPELFRPRLLKGCLASVALKT